MPEPLPISDSTVRMDTGRPSGRPSATGQGPQVAALSADAAPEADPLAREVTTPARCPATG
jgi:hypothetical protein